MPTFEKRSHVATTPERLFEWHARPGAFERLAPPWEPVEVLERRGSIRDGDELLLRTGRWPFRRRWLARHEGYEPGRAFVDVQIEGPFARWRHAHRMEPAGPAEADLVDQVDYRLPLAPLSSLVAGAAVRRRLARLFRYRHAVTTGDLGRHAGYADAAPRTIAVTGASGLVGTALQPFLTTGGHAVRRLVRSRDAVGEDAVYWRPSRDEIDASGLDGVDAVVHLAGAGIADARWTEDRKRELLESRTKGTGLIARTLAGMERKPSVLVCASAIGFYGDRGDEIVDHRSDRGEGFLADVVEAWERAADPARDAGIRVVHVRLAGMVLSPDGGALGKMLPAFRLGAGGPVGGGDQWWTWIGIDDAVDVLHAAVMDPRFEGPIDAVAPEAVRSRDFASVLGRVLRRPAFMPLPARALELVFGREMVQSTLLASTRVRPAALEALEFPFRHARLEGALRHLLGR